MGIIALILAALAIIAGLIFLRRNEKRLEDEAERAMPGPLDNYQSEKTNSQHNAQVKDTYPNLEPDKDPANRK